MTARYDVFLSLGGEDRDVGRRLAGQLRAHQLRVFVDEDDIGYFGGITAQIEEALRSSKTFVVYFSRTYAQRPSCQLELTAVFLAGQAEGSAIGRILVINPEPGESHLHPVELSDARYLPGSLSLADQARIIADRVRLVDGVIGDVRFRRRPRRSFGRIPGSVDFVGRYREQWALHSALFAADLPLSQERSSAPVVCVSGLPGVGKTSLVSAYARNFGAAFSGGVYWTSLVDGGREPLAAYDRQVLDVARFLGLDLGSAHRHRVRGAVVDHLEAQGDPSLWIVDDVPDDLDPALLHELVLPAGQAVRTILISDRLQPSDAFPSVPVGGLDSHDAAVLLERRRPSETADDRSIRDCLVEAVGGHAGALAHIGRILSAGTDVISYSEVRDASVRIVDTLAASMALDAVVAALSATPQVVLRLGILLNGQPVPGAMVVAALEDCGLVDRRLGPALTAVTALGELHTLGLAEKTDAGWLVHPLVLRAAERRMGDTDGGKTAPLRQPDRTRATR